MVWKNYSSTYSLNAFNPAFIMIWQHCVKCWCSITQNWSYVATIKVLRPFSFMPNIFSWRSRKILLSHLLTTASICLLRLRFKYMCMQWCLNQQAILASKEHHYTCIIMGSLPKIIMILSWSETFLCVLTGHRWKKHSQLKNYTYHS